MPALRYVKLIISFTYANLINLYYHVSIAQVLLSRTSFFNTKLSSKAENVGLQKYKETADAIMCGLLPKSPTATTSRTSGKFYSL